MQERDKSLFGSLRGIVETIEQKSGLNPLLFLDSIICLPSIAGYAFSGRSELLFLVWAPVAVTILFFSIAFVVDRNFLRSEKHVREMKQLDIIGEKGKELPIEEFESLPSVPESTTPKQPQKNTKVIGDGDKDV